MDFLKEAKKQIGSIRAQVSEEAYLEYGLTGALIAVACALIALVELLIGVTRLSGTGRVLCVRMDVDE